MHGHLCSSRDPYTQKSLCTVCSAVTLLKVIHKESHICLQLVLSYSTRPGPGMSCSIVTTAVRTDYSHSPISSPIEEALNSFLPLAGHGHFHGRSFTGQTIFLIKLQLHSLRSICLFRFFRSGRTQLLSAYQQQGNLGFYNCSLCPSLTCVSMYKLSLGHLVVSVDALAHAIQGFVLQPPRVIQHTVQSHL